MNIFSSYICDVRTNISDIFLIVNYTKLSTTCKWIIIFNNNQIDTMCLLYWVQHQDNVFHNLVEIVSAFPMSLFCLSLQEDWKDEDIWDFCERKENHYLRNSIIKIRVYIIPYFEKYKKKRKFISL